MQSTGLGYKPVERLSEYEFAEVGDEQTRSSPLPTQKLSNGPAKWSAQAPQKLSHVQFLPFSIQILLTIFPVLFIGIFVVTNSSSPLGWRRGHWSALEPPGIVDYLSGGRPWNVLEGSLPQCL
jgi:hypothetical protein